MWHSKESIRSALNNLRDIFQDSLIAAGYDFENDPLLLRPKWCDGMVQVHTGLAELEIDRLNKIIEIMNEREEK